MRAFLAMVKRELRAVTREKTIMIAVLIQLCLASFSSVIIMGLVAYYDPESIALNARVSIRAGVVGDTESALARFLEAGKVRVRTFASPEAAEAAFKAGRVDTIIYIPDETSGVVDMQLYLPESESRSTVILMMLQEPLKKYENYLRKERGISVRYADIEGKSPASYEFLYSSIIPILMFFPAFVAGSMVVDSVSEELEHHTLDTLWSAPVSLNAIFGAKAAAALVLAAMQCVAWIGLLRLNRIQLANAGLVLLLSLLVAGILSVAAAFIASYFKDRERSQFMYSLFMMIAAGVSYFLDSSPITLMTRLATGDYYIGILNLAGYVAVMMALLVLFLLGTRRLIGLRS